MPIHVKCDQCFKEMNIPDDFPGDKGKCPRCGNVIQIRKQEVASPATEMPKEEAPKRQVTCSSCYKFITVPPNLKQTKGKCPSCGSIIDLAPDTPPPAKQSSSSKAPLRSKRKGESRVLSGKSYGLSNLNFGEMIGRIFTLIVTNFHIFFLIIGLANLPYYIIQSTVRFRSYKQMIFFMIVGLVLTALGQGALVVAAASRYTGQSLNILDCFSESFRRVGKLIGATIIFYLAAIGIGFVLGLFSFIFTLFGKAGIIIAQCLIFYIILRLALTYCLYVPVLMIEDTGVIDSFSRSKELTFGSLWEIFGIFFVVGLVIVGMSYFGTRFFVQQGIISVFSKSFIYYRSIVDIISKIFLTVPPILIFFNLKVRKEAFGIDALADVFD